MRTLEIADLFCGAGGSSTGALEAGACLGYDPRLTAVNHWNRATETLLANHPEARVLCTGVDNINPRDLYTPDQLDVLLASPECTHFSVARGGRPVNEQSRATAMCVIRWAETLRPPVIIVENVPEFRTWGPLIRKRVEGKLEWTPDPKRKGELFRAWIVMLEATGYRVDHRVINCADNGDPTTRKRLFIQAVRPPRKICWPEPTHSEKPSTELFAGRRRSWATARDHVIDWTLPGQSIYERKRPLSPKTMQRIMTGLQKFGLKPFIVPGYNERAGQTPRTHSIDAPAPTVAATGHTHLAEPFIIPQQSGKKRVRSINKPLQSVTTESRGIALVEPFLVNMKGQSNAASIDKPAPTLTSHAAHLSLAEPFLIQTDQTGGNGHCVRSIEQPHTAVVSKQNSALIEPCLIKLRGTNNAADIDKPCPTVAGSGGHIALAEFIIGAGGAEYSAKPNTVDKPLNTVIANDRRALVEPFLVQVNHGNGNDKKGNARRVRSIKAPMPTICGARGEHALIEPALLPQNQGGSLRPVTQPVPTVATDGAIALVEPFLVKFYGTANAASVDKPLDTVTGKHRFGLARPVVEINGQQFQLDIRFRMLQPHELAAAQGFKSDYRFTGTKTEIVKMIGNAVPRRTMRALILAAYGQQPNVGNYLDQKEAAA